MWFYLYFYAEIYKQFAFKNISLKTRNFEIEIKYSVILTRLNGSWKIEGLQRKWTVYRKVKVYNVIKRLIENWNWK